MFRITSNLCAALWATGATAALLLAQTPPPPGGAAQPVPKAAPAPPARASAQVDPVAAERGHSLFQPNCAFCHGGNAKGGESGPNLLRSVLVIHDEAGDQIGPVIKNGRPDKGMPKFPFTDQQIADISAFLQQRIHAAAERDTYQILNIVTGNPKAGQAYFEGAGGCAGCHSVTGDLAHIGSKLDPVGVQQAIVMPREGGRRRKRKAGDPGQAITAAVTTSAGEVVRGRLEHIDDFSVAVEDDNGEYHSFTRNGDVPKVELHDPLQAHLDLLRKYSDTDIHNLTAYLVTLK